MCGGEVDTESPESDMIQVHGKFLIVYNRLSWMPELLSFV